MWPMRLLFFIPIAGAIVVDQTLAGLNDTAYDMFIYVYDGHTLMGPRSLTVKITGIDGYISKNLRIYRFDV
jgi:hypothetical protein